jgi:hypothetical protein
MITKQIGKVTFAYEPTALNGKGWWFILGKNGALGRAASIEEGQKLGKPKQDKVTPPKDVDKTESAPKKEQSDDRYYYDIAKTGRNAGKPIKRQYRTSSEYEKYDVIRNKGFRQLVNEKMMSGEGLGSSLKGAMSDKIGAKSSAIKKKFDSLNMLSKIPGVGSIAATAMGMRQAKKDPRRLADLSYFTGVYAPPSKLEEPEKEEGGSSKRKTKTSYKQISSDKSSVGILKSIHNMLATRFKADDEFREEQRLQAEIDSNFKEERLAEDERKHKELIEALLGKGKKPEKAKKDKEEGGFFSNLLSLFKGFMPMLGGLFTGLMSTIGGFLTTAITGIVSGLGAILAPLASILLPLIAVIGGIVLATKAISWLSSKITGKPMDYADKGEYDKKTASKETQKDFETIGRGNNQIGPMKMTEKDYENNKKTLASDKPVSGFQDGKWVKDVRPGLQKKNEAYERVQEYKKTSDDPLQQYRRGVESGEVKRETSFEDFKKQKGITQDTSTKIVPTVEDKPTATPMPKSTSTTLSGTISGDPTKHPNYKKYLDEELKRSGNSRLSKNNAYDKATMRVQKDMLKEQSSAELDDREAQQMIDDAKASGALQDPGKEKQLSRLNEATTTNQNLNTTSSSTIVPVVNNTNNIVSGGSGGGGGGVPMGVRNEEPILMQVQYGKVRPV